MSSVPDPSASEPIGPAPAGAHPASPARRRPLPYPIIVGLLGIATAVVTVVRIQAGQTWTLTPTRMAVAGGIVLVVSGAIGLVRRRP